MHSLKVNMCYFDKHHLCKEKQEKVLVTRERGGSSDTRLSSMSCRISSALRKQVKGRNRQAQWRASTQVALTSEAAEI